jgi:hypothetical protein
MSAMAIIQAVGKAPPRQATAPADPVVARNTCLLYILLLFLSCSHGLTSLDYESSFTFLYFVDIYILSGAARQQNNFAFTIEGLDAASKIDGEDEGKKS